MEYIIEMLGITKEFPGIVANDEVSLQLKKGEIHALLGENGAGKSTLMSVLFGMYRPEKGIIKKNGYEMIIRGPSDANRQGIGMVHQHFKLVHNFTVLENIVLGVETTRKGLLKMDKARQRVAELSARYGLKVNPDARVSDIGVGMQQRVEILKMLFRENEILIFDEPTAVLIPQEVDELMKIMRGLAAEGKSILFITHKLNEIKAVADRCTILRKGRRIATVEVAETSVGDMSEMMVGRKVNLQVEKKDARPGEVLLDVQDLTVHGGAADKSVVRGVTFQVRAGEIVSIVGVDGNGQSELVYAITGLLKADRGSIKLGGRDLTKASVRERTVQGIGHIPEDRQKFGLVLDYDLALNLALQTYFTPRFQNRGFLRYDAIYQNAEELIEKYDIRTGRRAHTIVRSMSGGNQQKAIIAREIEHDPKLLVAVQPTRGLDVGAIEYIHKKLLEERDRGKGILLVSLELDEVMNISDRILIIYEGAIIGELDPRETTMQEMGLYMSGSKKRGDCNAQYA